MTYDKILISKAEAIIILARASEKRCQGGTYLLRVISNILSIGSDKSSEAIKARNKTVSREAAKLRERVDFKTYSKLTVNEHQEPLKIIWTWIVENRNDITPEMILSRVHKYPMVTITRDEDQRLTKLKFRSVGDPKIRFEAAGIEIVNVEKPT